MGILMVLRSLLLCLLALGFHGSPVNAGQDSTDAELSSTLTAFTEPSTVKDALDLLARLDVAGVMPNVIQDIRRGIQPYLHLDDGTDSLITERLTLVLKWIPHLRKGLLKDPDQYGKYSDFDPSGGSVIKYVDTLVKWIPVLHHELWFLYFQTGILYRHLGGYWSNQQFGPSHSTTQLQRWLTSKGFQPDELHESKMGDQSGEGEQNDYFKGIHSHGESLNYTQYGLFFLSPWHDSNLASAVLFLQEFCVEVTKEDGVFKKDLSDKKAKPLKSACGQLSGRLVFLTDVIHPLHDGSITMYKGHLKADALGLYLVWLRKNLDGIIVSLEQMLSDSEHWTKDAFANARSPGPFMYGFVFQDSDWDSETFQSQLKASIDCLIGPVSEESLQKLKEHLQKTSEGGESPEVTTTIGTLRDLAGSLEGLHISDGTA